jgi:hypothetical protein
MHNILHFDAARDFAKPMQVMPKAIRAEALLVHEQMRLDDVGDFGDPLPGNMEMGRS